MFFITTVSCNIKHSKVNNTFLAFSLLNNEIKHFDNLKTEIVHYSTGNLQALLDKYSIKDITELRFKDPNNYYLFAKVFNEKFSRDKWALYFLQKSIKNDSLFKKEAIDLYSEILIKSESFEDLKKFVNDNKALLSKSHPFLLDYADGKGMDSVTRIEPRDCYLELVYTIIDRSPADLKESANQRKVHDYLIETEHYKNSTSKFINRLKKIKEYSADDYFIQCLYYYKLGNGEIFSKKLNTYLKNTEAPPLSELKILRKYAIRLGLRRRFYDYLKAYVKITDDYLYYFGLETLHFEGYKNAGRILKEYEYFNDINYINFLLRYYKLYYSKEGLTDAWLTNVVSLCNDYPEYKATNQLMQRIFSRAILDNKAEVVLPYIKQIDFSAKDSLQKSILLYELFLLDKNNKDEWKKILSNDCPLSYASLKVNNGAFVLDTPDKPADIVVETVEPVKDEKKTGWKSKRSKKNKKDIHNEMELENTPEVVVRYLTADKVKYLLEFNFYHDALNVIPDDISDEEGVMVWNSFYEYFLAKKDYYRALHYSMRSAISAYGDKYHNTVNKKDYLERLYPVYYKEIVLKYASQYDIDPALVFAVIREESHFKTGNTSHMNAIGLMQIIPSTGEFIAQKMKLKKYNLRYPEDNIKMGVYYLNFLKRYFDNPRYILACYNAGQGRMKQWYKAYGHYPEDVVCELIPIVETRDYIRKVMRSYYIYKFLLENENA